MYIIDKSKPIEELAQYLLEGEDNYFANISNLSALIFYYYSDLNWAGFYMKSGNELILASFQGLPACIRIKIGRGVCGTCAESGISQIIDDVHSFSGHIACDSASNSELVVPIKYKNEIIGVIDLDSPVRSRFNETICNEIEKIAEILIKNSNCEKAISYYK